MRRDDYDESATNREAWRLNQAAERVSREQAPTKLHLQPPLEPFGRNRPAPIPRKGIFGQAGVSKVSTSSDYLSAHFSLPEMCFSETAIRLGLDNVPGQAEISNLRDLVAVVLEPARLSLGALKVNSAFRAPLVNWYVRHPGRPAPETLPNGGQHPLGQAADIRPLSPIVSLAHVYSWISRWVEFDQIILEFNHWIHVSYHASHNRRQRLIGELKQGIVHYRPVDYKDNLS